jgi:hypothetical protein
MQHIDRFHSLITILLPHRKSFSSQVCSSPNTLFEYPVDILVRAGTSLGILVLSPFMSVLRLPVKGSNDSSNVQGARHFLRNINASLRRVERRGESGDCSASSVY